MGDATGARYAADPDRRFESFAEFYQDSAYAAFPQEHRSSGSFGLNMIEASQDPIDFVDPSVPEYIMMLVRTAGHSSMIDHGDGRIHTKSYYPSFFHIVPSNTASHYRVDEKHGVMGATLPERSVTRIFERSEVHFTGFGRWHQQLLANSAIAETLDRLWSVSRHDDVAGGLLADGLTLQLLALAAGADALAPLSEDARPEDARIARVVDYVEAHLGDPLGVPELATIACLSPGHFSRTFKATTGQPVWTYVHRRRCERAREMLLATPLAIAEIAYRCGFSSQSHMTRATRSTFGTTPGEIRRAAA